MADYLFTSNIQEPHFTSPISDAGKVLTKDKYVYELEETHLFVNDYLLNGWAAAMLLPEI